VGCDVAWLAAGTHASRLAFVLLLPSGGNNNALEYQPSRSRPAPDGLLAVIALLILIVAACFYFMHETKLPPHSTAFIEPSQTVRW
jgi:hypothetical protein